MVQPGRKLRNTLHNNFLAGLNGCLEHAELGKLILDLHKFHDEKHLEQLMGALSRAVEVGSRLQLASNSKRKQKHSTICSVVPIGFNLPEGRCLMYLLLLQEVIVTEEAEGATLMVLAQLLKV